MTTTAYDDQFAPDSSIRDADATQGRQPPGWTTREMVDMYAQGRADERAEVVALLLKHGYRQIADAIEAGRHTKQAPA